MDYLVTMTTHVPDGTSDAAVADVRAREAGHSRDLAAARDLVRWGHVLRSRRVLPCGPWPAGVHVVSLAE